ncbi:MAG: hypothetical protein GX595_05530 [Lentisphaerae bacterium]|nr:hypothetical protein [Lentisphaerota bacterium]
MRRAMSLLACVLVSASVWSAGLGDAAWPSLTALPLASPPRLDGRIDDDEWSGATRLSGFVLLGSRRLAAGQPEARVAWLEAGLAVAVSVPLPPGRLAQAHATDWDGTVWQDDSVEVHVDPRHEHKVSYQFVANALGTRLDSRAGDVSYNADWQAAAVNTPGRWSVEFLIPWSAMESAAPAAGQGIGINLAVNASHLGGILTWSPLSRGLHAPAQFAHLRLGRGTALSLVGLDAQDLSGLQAQLAGPDAAEVTWSLGLRQADGGVTAAAPQTVRLAAGAAAPLALALPVEQGLPKPGLYAIEVTARTAAGVLLRQAVDVEVGAPLELRARAFLSTRTLVVSAVTDGKVLPAGDTEVWLTVDGPAGRVAEQRGAPDGQGLLRLEIPGERVPSGRLTVSAGARQRRSGLTVTAEKVLDDPLQPAWLGTREGLSREVPSPWTPLRAHFGRVSCWGREYAFERSVFPSAVESLEAELLAAPIQLSGYSGAAPIRWRGRRVRWEERAADRVVLSTAATADELRLEGRVTIEYDGMVRVDATLTPTAGTARLRDLTLEIPLRADQARLLYHFPGRWGSVANSGALPAEGWTHGFKPYVWLGSEDRGLAWFCESDRHWYPQGSAEALTIRREGDRVVLRCHLIRGEHEIAAPLEYTFGFQATPVKKPEKTVWEYRITHHGRYGLESDPVQVSGAIVYPAEGRLRAEAGTLECWYRPGFDNQERGVPVAQRRQKANRHIVTVRWDDAMATGTNCGLYWNEQVQGPVVWSRREGKVLLNPGAPMDWTPGRWYHLAVTWGDTVRLYVDGVLAAESPNHGFVPADPAGATLEIGGTDPLATIDDLRILSAAVAPGAPAEAATVLLHDDFEAYGQDGLTPPGERRGAVVFGPGHEGRGASWEPSAGQTQLARLAEAGVRTICFHEHWSPYQSHPYVTAENRPKLKSLVDGCRGAGVDLLLYMSRQFADNAPEWELYSEDVLQQPRSGAYRRLPEQKAYIACWNSAWRDFCLYHLARLLDEVGHDGWYLDGPEWPMPCNNPDHGCGYDAPDGTRRTAYDIFGTREFMKRLYVLTRQRRPDGQLNIHNSTVMVTPTLSWATSTWGGEQIDTIKPPVRTLDILPMDAFRTEFMGRQWGLPAEFLVYEGRPYRSRDVEAYTLLHGVLIRPHGDPESLARSAALWRMYDGFPFKDAACYPYWDNAERLSVGPAGVYATAWERPGEGLLVIVSNLGDDAAEATVALAPKAFRWTPSRVTDALTGEPVPLADGVVRFTLEPWRYRFLRVWPGSEGTGPRGRGPWARDTDGH